MQKRFSLLVGVGTLLALAPACGSKCLDDGFAWSQSKEECVADSATATDTETGTTTTSTATATETDTTTMGTMTVTNSGTESDTATETDTATDTDGGGLWCKDVDMDGQGDPESCIPSDGGEPPPGYVPNAEDCDDLDEHTYKGAAEIEFPDLCATDVDGDGWAEPNPADGVTPGTDCLDNNPYVFPGAAEIEDATACMKDEDDDGWGDINPPAGAVAGTDCVDTDVNTFPGASENEGDPKACTTDADGDGWGDSNPPPGSTPGSDCDDSNEFTFPGSAPNDDPDACLKDEDDDDWGDLFPPDGVDMGTDCNDASANTYPGAAELEEESEECMADEDEDGYGDDNPENPNVVSGNDCNDSDASIFMNCADCTPDEFFCEADELHLCNMNGTGSKLEEVCEFGCDMENGVCYDILTVDAGESVCIDKGAMAQLQAVTMGGDGAYVWDWTPAGTLSDAAIENPVATPNAATTYMVTVTDGKNSMASDNVSVFIKGASLVLDDESCKITNFGWDKEQSHSDPVWSWDPNNVELCETANAHPSARFCGWELNNANLQGRFAIKTNSDDDWMGFMWGIQPFDQMTTEPEQFYFMGWKQSAQLGTFCSGDGKTGRRGIIVKRIDVKDVNTDPLSCADFHSASDTTNSVLLADEDAFTTVGWKDNVSYIFDLTHTPTGFTVKIIQENNMMVIAEKDFIDDTYPSGQVGFYAYSQQQACFKNFQTSCL